MILYLDASALVKRYIAEEGSVEVEKAISAAAAVFASVATLIEVGATVARASRAGRLSSSAGQETLAKLVDDWRDVTVVPLDAPLARRAFGVACTNALRGYDAVHLATALFVRDRLGESVTMATFDRELANAAHSVGLGTVPADLEAWRAEMGRGEATPTGPHPG